MLNVANTLSLFKFIFVRVYSIACVKILSFLMTILSVCYVNNHIIKILSPLMYYARSVPRQNYLVCLHKFDYR